MNVPIEAGATDGDYVRVFELGVLPVLEEFKPGLLLVSAGFDAHEQDPLAQMRMTSAGLRVDDRQLRAMADRVCGRARRARHRGRVRAAGALGESLDLALRRARPATTTCPHRRRLAARATGRGDRALAARRAPPRRAGGMVYNF